MDLACVCLVFCSVSLRQKPRGIASFAFTRLRSDRHFEETFNFDRNSPYSLSCLQPNGYLTNLGALPSSEGKETKQKRRENRDKG